MKKDIRMSMRIGSIVKLNPVGFKDDIYNPIGTEGKIISFDGKYNPIIVEWETGIRNAYHEKSLIVIKR